MNKVNTRYNINFIFTMMTILSMSFLISLFVLQLVVILLFCLWLFESNSDKKKAMNKLSMLIFMFLIVRFVSSLFSNEPQSTLEAMYKESLLYIGFFSMQFYFKSIDKFKILKLIQYFIYTGLAVSLVGILKFNLGYVHRAESLTSGTGMYATYLVVILSAFLFLENKMKTKYDRLLFPFQISILLTGLVLSLVRMDVLIAVVIIFLAIIYKYLDYKSAIKVFILTGFFSFISLTNNREYFDIRLKETNQMSNRDIIWKGVIPLIYEKPILGHSPGSFKHIFPYWNQLPDKGVHNWHNEIIQMYMEGGILGIGTFLAILIYFFSNARNLFCNHTSVNLKITEFKSIFFGFVGLLLTGITSCLISSIILSILFAFLLAVFDSILKPSVYAREN